MNILDIFRKKQPAQKEYPSPRPPPFLPEEFERFRMPPPSISPAGQDTAIPRQEAEPVHVVAEIPEGIPRPKELIGMPERYEPIEIVSRAGQLPYSQPAAGPEAKMPAISPPSPPPAAGRQEFDRISLILQKLETIDARLKLIEERLGR